MDRATKAAYRGSQIQVFQPSCRPMTISNFYERESCFELQNDTISAEYRGILS